MLNFNSLKEKEMISFTQYLKVVKINKKEESITVEDRNGNPIHIGGKDLIESMYSNSQYNETQKVGKHELAGVLQTAGDKIFTICFTKSDKTERILTGHFLGIEPNLGRTKVLDLNIDPKDPTKGIRLVDNREIKWVVIDDTRYISY